MDSRQVTSALQQWPGLDGKSGKRTRHLVKVPKDQKELLDAKENWANNLINNPMPPDIYPRKYGILRAEAYRRQGNPTPPMGQGEQPNSGSTASPQKLEPRHQTSVVRDNERTPERDIAPSRNGNTPGSAASSPARSWSDSPEQRPPTRPAPAPYINVQAASSPPHEERSQESARDLPSASSIKRVSVEKSTESQIEDADSSDSSDGDLEIQQPMRMPAIARVSNLGQLNQTPTSAQVIIPSTDPSSMLVPSAASVAAQHPMRKVSPADMSSAPMPSTSAPSTKPRGPMKMPDWNGWNMPGDMPPTTTSRARPSVAPPPANLPPSMSIDSYATPEERIPASSVPVADMGDIELEESPRQPQPHSRPQLQIHPEAQPEPETRSLPRKPSPPQPPPVRPTTEEVLPPDPSPQPAQIPETPYEAYIQAYPKYQGGLDGFVQACAYIEALNNKMRVPVWLFDDIIRAIHEGYIPYALSSNISNPDTGILSAWSWYVTLTDPPEYIKKIITNENLAAALHAHAGDLIRIGIARAHEPGQQAAPAQQEVLLARPPSEALRGSSSQELVGSQLITEDEAVMTSNEDDDEDDMSPEDDEDASSSSDDDDQDNSSQRGASDEEMEDVPPTRHAILSRTMEAETPQVAKEKNAREASFTERTDTRPARRSMNELTAALSRPPPVDEDDDAMGVEAMESEAMGIEPATADFEYGFQTQEMEDEAQVDDWTRKSPPFNMSAASSRASSSRRVANREASEPIVKKTPTASRKDWSATSSRPSSRKRNAELELSEPVVKRARTVSRTDRSASTHRFSDHRTPSKGVDMEGHSARASSAAQESRAEVNVSTQGVPSPILGRSMSHSTSFNSAVSHQPSARESAARPSPEFIKPPPKVPRAPSITPSSTFRKRSYTYMEDDPSSSIRSNKPEYKDETPDQRRKRRMRELIERRKSKGSAPSSARSSMGA